jgi:subtilisin family serine protease
MAVVGLVSFIFSAPQGLCVNPFDNLLDEVGDPIPSPVYGQPGVDFADLQFIASFKPSYLSLPPGKTEAPLGQCSVEKDLKNLLVAQGVYYVKQVFKGYQQGDTIRIVDSDIVFVPDLSQIYLLLQNGGVPVLNAIDNMYRHHATLYAEPNQRTTLFAIPNDPFWDEYQWNLKTNDYGIGCPVAWQITPGSTAVKIAILDAGIKWEHEDFGGDRSFPNDKIAGGWDYVDNDPYPEPYYFNHGSGVAGVAAALTNNDIGIAGIAGGWNRTPDDIGALIYALRIYPADYATIASAIRDAADPNVFGCSILSNSWGTENCNTYSEVIREGIHWAYRLGASFVAAKGNSPDPCRDPSEPVYPADYGDRSWITAVGSYGENGIRCTPVNCNYYSCYGNGIDITAPGHNIWTTKPFNHEEYSIGNGTSFACPHATGSIAIIRSLLSDLWNEDTDWILKYSAWDPPPLESDGDEWTWNPYYGHGQLRISTVVDRISGPSSLQPWEFFSHFAEGGDEAFVGFFTEFYFKGIGDLREGVYSVVQYDVRVAETYDESFREVPYVWGIGMPSRGWSGAHPNYQVGFSKVVPGTATITGCQLQTFVYKVYERNWGDFLGWYPCEPESVSLAYKLWGIPTSGAPKPKDGREMIYDGTPQDICFAGCYPNPFNTTTSIKFGVPEDCQVSLTVYDLLGRKVNTLMEGHVPSGYHTANWDGRNHAGIDTPSGLYFCTLKANEKILTRKVVMLK